jgi:hypothetical protein
MEGTAALICRAGTDHRASAAAQTRQPKEAYGCQCGAAVLVTGGSGRGPVRPGGAARDRRRAGPPRHRRARPPRGGGGGGRGGGGQTFPREHSFMLQYRLLLMEVRSVGTSGRQLSDCDELGARS